MDKYNIYAGLGGSFGGANYKFTTEANSLEEATDIAYQVAVEEYEGYEGFYGLKTWIDCAEELHRKEWKYPSRSCNKCTLYPCFKGQENMKADYAKDGCKNFEEDKLASL